MSSRPRWPSRLHGALGCSALPPGSQCSAQALSAPPRCSVLPLGAQRSPLGAQRSFPVLSASPGCSVLPLGAQCSPLVLSAPLQCSALPPGAQRSRRPGGDQPCSWVSASSRPSSQFCVTNLAAHTDSFLLTSILSCFPS